MPFRFIFPALVFAALTPAQASASSLESLKSLSLNAFEAPLQAQFQRVERKDLFAEVDQCRIVDIKGLGVYNGSEAAALLAPCAKALSKRLKAKVRIETGEKRGFRGLDMRFPSGVRLSMRDTRDLHYSLEKRENKLLGFPVRLIRERAASTSRTFRPVPVFEASSAKKGKGSKKRATPGRRGGDSNGAITDPGDLDELGNPRRRTSPGPDDGWDGPSRGDGGDDYIGGYPLF
jgi:hypothetical protein